MLFLLWIFFTPCTSIELNDLLNELSWNLKLKLLNDVVPKYPSVDKKQNYELITPKPLPHHEAKKEPRRMAIQGLNHEMVRVKHAPHYPENWDSRRSAIQPFKRRDEGADPQSNDDNDMRMKLFRLMYETVRDSDLKVKRAELIREHYVNSTAFEIGYLLGDVTDKYNVMTDISTTLERFYREWKPIEHINAYEQIANQAIEINHLVDLIRIVSKRDAKPSASTPKV